MSFESNTVESDKQDKIIPCKDCGEEFIFTVREQEFYAQKGFTNDPTRCALCRAARKQGQPRVTNEVNMSNPRRDNYNSRPPRPNQPNPGYGNRQDNYGNSGGYNNRNDNYNNVGNNNNNYGNSGGYNNRNDNYANRGARPGYNNNNAGGYNNRNDNQNNGGNNYGNNSYGNRNDNYGNRRDNNFGNSGFGQRSNVSNYGQNQERKLYNIVCSNCGIETQVPFVPRPGVPVFCKSCYNSQKTGRY